MLGFVYWPRVGCVVGRAYLNGAMSVEDFSQVGQGCAPEGWPTNQAIHTVVRQKAPLSS